MKKKPGALGRLAGALGGQARRSRPGRGTGRARAAWRRGTASRALGGRWRPPAWRGRRAGLERRGAAGSRRLDPGRRAGLRLGAGDGGRSRQVGSGGSGADVVTMGDWESVGDGVKEGLGFLLGLGLVRLGLIGLNLTESKIRVN